MADNKKYYYLKLKDNFFESDKMILLESMPDGYLYSNILLKMYLRSLKGNGCLMVSERIPYNPQMLASAVRHPVGVVEKALDIFRELELVEIIDSGAIYMMDIQNFIGQSSTEADRVREYRNRIASESQPVKLTEQPEVEFCEGEEIIAPKRPHINYSAIVEDYNRTCTNLPACKKLSEARKKSISARLKTYSPEELHTIFQKAQDSPFLCGMRGDFKANFDWLLKDKNAAKVLDGNYDDRKGGEPSGNPENAGLYDDFTI